MAGKKSGTFQVGVIRQYYVSVFPLSYKHKVSRSSVIKSLLGDSLIPLIKKRVVYENDFYGGRQVWQFSKECLNWQLSRQKYGGLISNYYSKELDNISEIRIASGVNGRLGYRYIIMEFCIDTTERGTDGFPQSESNLDSMQIRFFNSAIRKRHMRHNLSKDFTTFNLTYIATKTDLSIEQAYLEMRLGNFPQKSRLPKDPITYKFQEETLEKADSVGKYLHSLQVSKRNTWILDMDIAEKSGLYLVLVGAQRGQSEEVMNPYGLRLCGLFADNVDFTELYSPFKSFEKSEEGNYFSNKSYLESIFDSLLNLNLEKATLSMGLSLEIDALHDHIGQISNSITNYGRWSRGKLLKLHSKILDLTIRAFEYKSRIQAFQKEISSKRPKKSKFEFKVPNELFPYFDYQDSILASLLWSPDWDIDYGHFRIPETKPFLRENVTASGEPSLFTNQFIKGVERNLDSVQNEVEKAIAKLNDLSKRIEPVIVGIHNDRLLKWTLAVSVATIILVVINLLQIFGRL